MGEKLFNGHESAAFAGLSGLRLERAITANPRRHGAIGGRAPPRQTMKRHCQRCCCFALAKQRPYPKCVTKQDQLGRRQ